MNMKLKRVLATLLCLSMLSGSLPAWAREETLEAPPELETIVESSPADAEQTPTAAPLPVEGDHQSAAPLETDQLPEANTPTPSATPEAMVDPQAQLAGAIADLSARLAEQNLGSDYEKALWIYSMMLANISTGTGSTAYDAIVGCEADALGYARAMEALMNAAGLECIVVQGDASAWIVARLDGEWTHLHPYADDVSGAFGAHFGLTDAAMARVYSWNRADVPACTGSANCFNVRASGYHAFENLDELSKLLLQAVEAQKENLKLYNAASLGDISANIRAILAENASGIDVEIAENDCFLRIDLHYAPEATSTPEVTSTPEITDAPTSEVTPIPEITDVPTPEITSPPEITDAPTPEVTSTPEITDAPTSEVTSTPEITDAPTPEATSIPEITDAPTPEATSIPEITDAPEASVEPAFSDEASIFSVSLLPPDAMPAVHVSATQIVPAATSVTLGVGERHSLANWTLLPEGAQDVIYYKSKSTKIATVNAEGTVTAKRTGATTITLFTESGLSATVKITVKKAPSKVSLKGETSTMGVGQTQQLYYTLSKSGSAGSATFASSNPDVATVTSDGLVTAVAPGKTTVSVTTYNGKKSSATLTIYAAPSAVIPALTAVSIGAEDAWKLGYSFNEGAIGSVSFSSSNTDIATVDADGTIHALKQGDCTVTITSHNGVSATCAVTVAPAPKSLALTASKNIMGVGEKLQLNPALEPAGTMGTIAYKSSSSKTASVNADGIVTAKRTGTVTITAYTYNGLKASFKIKIGKAPSKVSLKGETSTMGVGQTQQLYYTLSKSGSAGSATFASSNPDVATVTSDGLVTAVAPGKTTVSVTTYNGKKSSATLTIYAAPSAVIPALTAVSIGAEDAWKLGYSFNEGAIGSVSFSSSNTDIATVDADGTIHALKQGDCTVIITSHNGVSATCAVTVAPAPKSLALTASKNTMGVGEKLQLNPALDPAGTMGTIAYKSSSSKTASVNADGIVTAKRTGTVIITAYTYNGLKASFKIKIGKAPSKVSLKGETSTMGVGQTQQLYYILSKSGSAGSATFASSNPDVATVTSDGLVTAVAPGKTTVSVTTYNGKKSSATLTIYAAPSAVKLPTLPSTMGIGQKVSAAATLEPEGSYTDVRYSVVSGDAVSINSAGQVIAEKSGTATIRAATHVEGVYADFTISVLPAPKSISFAEDVYTVNIDEPMQLYPVLTAGSYSVVSYKVSKQGYFTIDENGLILPIQRGSANVTATTYNGLSATVKIVVNDPIYPEAMELAATPPAYLDVGESYTPSIKLTPSSAQADIVWTSSQESVCSVNANGKITALSYGQATITGKSSRNPSLMVSFNIIVLGTELCLTMPAHRSGTDDISKTLSQIKAVRASAYNILEHLYAAGTISKSDYDARHGYIERAFNMYLMPWMTDTYEYYWKASNSNDGLKDFKPGTVYYGLPYTQSNRTFNVSKAVNAGYFTKTSKGYYKLQGSKFANRQYPGNDCSSFVSMSIWGTGSEYSYLNTEKISSSPAYRTLSDWTDLRPGDIINKAYKHVVMFLYYANKDKTQMVIIEQGGGDDATNTISCSIRNVSYYTSRGYSIHRVKSLGY